MPCGKDHKKAQWRAYHERKMANPETAEIHRMKRRASYNKPEFQCLGCCGFFPRTSNYQKRCTPCAKEAKKATDRAWHKREYAIPNLLAPKAPKPIPPKEVGAPPDNDEPFDLSSPFQRVCEVCERELPDNRFPTEHRDTCRVCTNRIHFRASTLAEAEAP